MVGVKKGNVVKVSYTGTLSDGNVFDTTEGKAPFGFMVGSNDIISGFSDAFIGMQVGETKTITIPASEAYGPLLRRPYKGNQALPFPYKRHTKSGPALPYDAQRRHARHYQNQRTNR
jgi:FKBP-type peptidyl-prolyl cis-trans isomerase 2